MHRAQSGGVAFLRVGEQLCCGAQVTGMALHPGGLPIGGAPQLPVSSCRAAADEPIQPDDAALTALTA
ncbi:hypothetical protein MMUR_58750 [Mycolicibacterium murale]|uniref:Uncharacterized protein n=1 Tax=Mycolicibacterium murale TaxID=182220 RepID=A0A7I9WVY2_9MYCO|nr:hypothetical protein MMUR_58750 [Mycolicibacterium murale]